MHSTPGPRLISDIGATRPARVIAVVRLHYVVMLRFLQGCLKFLIAWFAMTVLCTIVWQYTAADLYDCTDDGFPPGYLEPGWVHQHSLKTVDQVVHGRSMSEP